MSEPKKRLKAEGFANLDPHTLTRYEAAASWLFNQGKDVRNDGNRVARGHPARRQAVARLKAAMSASDPKPT
jgi:hypothetical protein